VDLEPAQPPQASQPLSIQVPLTRRQNRRITPYSNTLSVVTGGDHIGRRGPIVVVGVISSL
jgi:hypothetical protein